MSFQATFVCEAISEQLLQYEWFHNEAKLSGQHGPELKLVSLTLEMDGDYVCRVFNGIAEKLSEVRMIWP